MHTKIRMMTTHVDKHNERVPVDALDDFVNLVNQQYVPVGVEHDPRIPPIGRLISAQIEELPDGEFAVDGIAEIYEQGKEIEFKDDGREIPLELASDRIQISPDRSYFQPEDKELLLELQEIVKGEIRSSIKKALEPISILIISASFIAGELHKVF